MANNVISRQSKKATDLFPAPLRSSQSSQTQPRKALSRPKTSPDGFVLGVDTLRDPFAENPRGQGMINQSGAPENKKERGSRDHGAVDTVEVRNFSNCVDEIEQLKLKANNLICDFQCKLAPEYEYYDYDYDYDEELEAESPTPNPPRQQQDPADFYTRSLEDNWQIFSNTPPCGWQNI